MFVVMLFTETDKILINNLFNVKGYNGRHLVRDFPSKRWNVGLVYLLLQKLWLLGGSTVVLAAADDAVPTADNIDIVNELVLHKNGQEK